jgi:hypothetical protein
MLDERVVVLLPAVEALAAQETEYIVRVVGERLEHETGLGQLIAQASHVSKRIHDTRKFSISQHPRCWGWGAPTSEGRGLLCGQCRTLGARELALDGLRFETGCGPWNDASRFSYMKNCLSSDAIAYASGVCFAGNHVCRVRWYESRGARKPWKNRDEAPACPIVAGVF